MELSSLKDKKNPISSHAPRQASTWQVAGEPPPSTMTQTLEHYKLHLELSSNTFAEIVNAYEHFTLEEENFINDFFTQRESDSDLVEMEKSGRKIIALQKPGNTKVYFYFDGITTQIIKPGNFRDVQRYTRLPVTVKESDFINPIHKISSRFDFYSTPMISGIEGEEILERIGPKDFAKKVANLLLWSSKNKVNIKHDIQAFVGHNVFLNLMTLQLMLFDHGSYDFNEKYEQEFLVKEYLLNELITAVGPYYSIMMGTPAFSKNEDGYYDLSTEYKQFFTFFVELSSQMADHFGWKTIPFYKITFQPSTRDEPARTIEEITEVPIPQTERDLAIVVLDALKGYISPRNRVKTNKNGETISREEAFLILKEQYEIN